MNNPDNRPVDAARDEPVISSGEPVAQPTDVWPADPEPDSLGDPVSEPQAVAVAGGHNPQDQAEQYQAEQDQEPRQDGGAYQEPQYAAGGYQPEQYPGGQYQPEQYAADQYQAEQYQAEQYAAQQYAVGYPGQQYQGQQYQGQQYPGQQYPDQQFPEQQFQGQSYEGQPASGQDPAGQTGGTGAAPRPQKTRRPRTDENGVAYGVGPFSLREAVFVILSALVVVASFFPFIGGLYAELFGYSSVWAPAPWLAIPGALLLAAAAALIVIRRLQPQRRIRVGSLSVDQFASVAAVTTAGFYVGSLFLLFGFTAWFRPGAFGNLGGDNFDGLTPGAGLILGLIFSLASIVPTAGAMFVPVFAEDFSRRAESPAHPVAREAAVVPVRPRPVRHSAEPQPEVHHYGLEHSGSVQLTPADTRPEDFAAYRRSGWSPDSATDTDSAYAEFQAAQGINPGLDTDAPDSGSPLAVQPLTGVTGATVDDSLIGDEVDEFQTGEEPAPVSAIRHVAEQESLADASGRETHEPEPQSEPLHPSAQEPGSRTEALPETLSDAPRETEHERTSQDADELAPELRSELTPELQERAPETDDELAPETAPEEALAPKATSEGSDRRAADAGHTASASQAAERGSTQSPPAVISTQPFWVYSPVPLAVVDEETGAPVFEIGPDAWALAIIDRGTELVIRHDDGRVGVLREIAGIMRG